MASPSSSANGQTLRDPPRRSNLVSSVVSISQSISSVAEDLVKDPPSGFSAATAEAAARAPTLGDNRRGGYYSDGWSTEGHIERRRRTLSQSSRQRKSLRDSERQGGLDVEGGGLQTFPVLTEEPTHVDRQHQLDGPNEIKPHPKKEAITEVQVQEPDGASIASIEEKRALSQSPVSQTRQVGSSGYTPPLAIPWASSTLVATKAFWKWFLTPFGFFVTIYGLNVVAWGGMLFLLLCNASPAMCWAPVPSIATAGEHSPAGSLALGNGSQRYFNCDDINSPRRIWLEIDSQILNALFCVTGFGTIPWRFRDLWYLLRWRCVSAKNAERKAYGLRVLAGIHRGWFRLPGSQTLDQISATEYTHAITPSSLEAIGPAQDPRLPLPFSKAPADPLTGVRATPTALWKLDLFIWCQVSNTLLQGCLCGFMWGYSRYNRPSWATGLFIALACGVAVVGGVVSFMEGKKVHSVEGVGKKDVEGH